MIGDKRHLFSLNTCAITSARGVYEDSSVLNGFPPSESSLEHAWGTVHLRNRTINSQECRRSGPVKCYPFSWNTCALTSERGVYEDSCVLNGFPPSESSLEHAWGTDHLRNRTINSQECRRNGSEVSCKWCATSAAAEVWAHHLVWVRSQLLLVCAEHHSLKQQSDRLID